MATNYVKFLEVLKKWPVDPKRKHCYGHHLREMLKNTTPNSLIFPGTQEENTRKINSLLRLTQNIYMEKYTYNNRTGSTGLKLDDLEIALTDEFMTYMNKGKF